MICEVVMNINQPECSDSLYNDKKEHIDETKLVLIARNHMNVEMRNAGTRKIAGVQAYVVAFRCIERIEHIEALLQQVVDFRPFGFFELPEVGNVPLREYQ